MCALGRINYFLLQPLFESQNNGATIGQVKAIYDAFNAKLLLYFVYDSSFNQNLFKELQGVRFVSDVQYEDGSDFWEKYLTRFFKNHLGGNVGVLLHLPKPTINNKTLIVLKHVGDAFYIKDGFFYCQQHNYRLYQGIKKVIAPCKLTYYCSSYYIPNGDIIETEDFVLLGRYSINNSGDHPADFLKELKKRRNWEYKDTYMLGPIDTNAHFYSALCFYHLDLYLMYLGRVACKHTFLLAKLEWDSSIHDEEDKATIDELNDALAVIAAILNNIGNTTVIRVLLPYIDKGIYTFINGIVENCGDMLKIYVPAYKLGDKQKQVYYDALFQEFIRSVPTSSAIITTADYTNQVFSYGALHCTMNVINREEC